MSTHIFSHLKNGGVTAEIRNGFLFIELHQEDGNSVYLNLSGDIIDIARKLGNPTVVVKRETANA
jgi:hypothetical protein